MIASERAWFNGSIVPRTAADPSVASNTLHLGIAVFDGIMAYRNGDRWYVHRGREHLERFRNGAARMDLVLPWSVDDMLAGIDDLLATVPPVTHYVRPLAYRTAPDVWFIVEEQSTSACIFAVPVTRDIDEPYACQLSEIQRVSHRSIPAAWKVSGAYANSYLAERRALDAGFDTGIMLDSAGDVAEAASSNLFFLAGDQLVTPRLTPDIFPGITRAVVIEQARARGAQVVERTIVPAELGTFDGAFLCGTLSEIRAIERIGDLRYDTRRRPGYRAVVGDFRSLTHGGATATGDGERGDVRLDEEQIRRALAGAARSALGRDVDPACPFGRLGATSLDGAVVLARVWESTGVRLPLSAVGPDATLHQLAHVLRAALERRA